MFEMSYQIIEYLESFKLNYKRSEIKFIEIFMFLVEMKLPKIVSWNSCGEIFFDGKS